MASELLSKYDQIINYLKGTNINLDGLNVSTVDLLKSCNGMLGIAGLFVSENSEVILAALPEMGGLSLGLICGVIIAPIVAICEAKPVGEPDGSIEEFYKTHPNWTVRVSPTEVNQIERKPNWDDINSIQRSETIPKNGDIYNLGGTDGDPSNKLKWIVGLMIGGLSVSTIWELYFNNPLITSADLSNFKFHIDYKFEDSKVTMVLNY